MCDCFKHDAIQALANLLHAYKQCPSCEESWCALIPACASVHATSAPSLPHTHLSRRCACWAQLCVPGRSNSSTGPRHRAAPVHLARRAGRVLRECRSSALPRAAPHACAAGNGVLVSLPSAVVRRDPVTPNDLLSTTLVCSDPLHELLGSGSGWVHICIRRRVPQDLSAFGFCLCV